MPPGRPLPGAAAAPAEAGPFSIGRYGSTRHWAVQHGAELVAVVLYRRGAAEVAQRLNAAAAAAAAAALRGVLREPVAVGGLRDRRHAGDVGTALPPMR